MRNGSGRLKGVGVLVLVATMSAAVLGSLRRADFWLTPDQQAARLERAGRWTEAAVLYTDPARQGAAYYRAGEFEKAAQAFARLGGAEGAYNQATALLMHGAYDASIHAYDRAISLRPGWQEAVENRGIAVARKARIESQASGDSTSDEKPDAIVFDHRKPSQNAPAVQLNTGEAPADDALRAQWLRRVKTRPANFLKAKFAYEQQAISAREN